MAALLDRWVPSRRLERKRQQALQEDLHARFGDTHITAPTEGAWNQISSDVDKDYRSGSITSHGLNSDLRLEKPSFESRLSMEKNYPHPKDSQRHNFTITIPLPWSSRKSHSRTPSSVNSTAMTSNKREEQPELSPRSFMSSPEPTPRSFVSSSDPNSKSHMASPNTTLDSPATSPVVIYKPISEEYKQKLAEMANGIARIDSPLSQPPDRAQNSSPSNVIYKPASEDFVKEMAEIGMGLSPAIPPRETFARPRAASRPAPIGLPSDPRPTPVNFSPDLRILPTGLPSDPRPIVVSHSPELRPAPMGLPVQPRPGTTRSSSRGPTADRVGTTRSASRGPASDRAGTRRSASRGPAPERIGATRSSSRGPASDRLPTTRSASRGPLSDRSANASKGRSSSRGPISTRIPYRESVSSESSAGSGISASSSPTFNESLTNTTTSSSSTNMSHVLLNTADGSHNDSVGSATGYYATVANEYRRIASEVEDSEYEKRRKKEIEISKKGKNKKHQAFQGPQEMVPSTDELW